MKQFPCKSFHQISDSVYIVNKTMVEISVEKFGNSNNYGSIYRSMLTVGLSYNVTKGTD